MKLKEESQKLKSLGNLKDEEFTKTRGKQVEEHLCLKEEYDIIYKKYLRYKEAYINCRSRIDRQRMDIINDQRFTEEIITHCKTLIGKKNW